MSTAYLKARALATLLVTGAPAIAAASVPAHELPAALAAELEGGAIEIVALDDGKLHGLPGRGPGAFLIRRGTDQSVLLRYDTLPGSRWHTLALGGQLFVEAPRFYSGGAARFTLHFDRLDPGIPPFAFKFSLPYTVVELQPDAMATGSGVYEFSGDPDYIASGNMSFVDNPPFLCIECEFSAQFDLVFLDYSTGMLRFDLDDPRTTLFRGIDAFYGDSPYGWDLDLVVTSIDLDDDGEPDASDNCLAVSNADQTDTDADGIGNICDADFNNDCFVNFIDLQAMRQGFFGTDPLFDLDGDGIVGIGDLLRLRQLVFQPPGPAAAPNLCAEPRKSDARDR